MYTFNGNFIVFFLVFSSIFGNSSDIGRFGVSSTFDGCISVPTNITPRERRLRSIRLAIKARGSSRSQKSGRMEKPIDRSRNDKTRGL